MGGEAAVAQGRCCPGGKPQHGGPGWRPAGGGCTSFSKAAGKVWAATGALCLASAQRRAEGEVAAVREPRCRGSALGAGLCSPQHCGSSSLPSAHSLRGQGYCLERESRDSPGDPHLCRTHPAEVCFLIRGSMCPGLSWR